MILAEARAFTDVEPLASAPATPPESEIMRLFRQCVAAVEDYNANYGNLSPLDPRCGAAMDAIEEIENEMLAIPAQTAQEMAAKVWCWAAYCAPGMNARIDPFIFADARRLLGLTT